MEFLLAEAVEPPAKTGRCTLSGGRWYSWYDDTWIDGPRNLDIDHMVSLAEARDSGAPAWPQRRRVTYANCLDNQRHLEAVRFRSNRQKADQDPQEWMAPDNPAERCCCLANWMAVQLRWDLSVDPAEQETMARIADECPDNGVTVNPVT